MAEYTYVSNLQPGERTESLVLRGGALVLRRGYWADITPQEVASLSGRYLLVPGRNGQATEVSPSASSPNALALVTDGSSSALNYARIQAAIAALGAQGGTIELPAGIIACSSSIDRGNAPVNLIGAGEGATVLYFPNDVAVPSTEAARIHAVIGGANRAVIRDLSIVGPGNDPALGQKPAQLSGVKLRDGQALEHVYIARFCDGINLWGNHQGLSDVKSTQNFRNCYYGPGASTFGDQTFTRCDFTGSKLASLAIAGDSMMDACTVNDMHLGFAPIGMLLEAKTTRDGALSNCVFNDLAFEDCGERHIFDEASGNTGTRRQVNSVRFNYPSGNSLKSAYQRPGANVDWIVQIGSISNCRFLSQRGSEISGPFTVPGALGGFAFGYSSDNRFEEFGVLLDQCRTLGRTPFFAYEGTLSTIVTDGEREGIILTIGAGPTQPKRLIARRSDSGAFSTPGPDATLAAPMGVLDAGQAVPNNLPGVVWRRGQVTAISQSAIAQGQKLVLDTTSPGAVKVAAAFGDKQIGYSAAASSGSSAPYDILVDLHL